MSQNILRRPIGVYLIAIMFLLAPLGNIIISFAGSGVENWYHLNVFFPMLQTIPALDWVWLGLLFITGILLFRPHKLSWTLAIVILILVLGINAFRLYQVDSNSMDPFFLKIFSILSIITTLSVLVIAMYFRFPYLDRRSKWLSKSDRFDFRTHLLVNDIKSITESISKAGCRVSFDRPSEFKQNDVVVLKFTEISESSCEAIVIEKLEFGARLEYKKTSAKFKQDLDRWLKGRRS